MTPTEQPTSTLPPRSSSGAPLVLGAIAALGLIGGAVWWLLSTSAQEDAVTPSVAVSPGPQAEAPLAAEEHVDNQAAQAPVDPTTFAHASSKGAWRTWLGEEEALSRAVAAAVRVSEGESPRALLGFLAPEGVFQVESRGARRVIAAASFARYDPLADVTDSLDVATLAAAYRRAHPVLSRLHGQLARPGVTLDATVSKALAHLISTPTLPAEVEVIPAKGVNYAYVDPALESASDAQKHILRMGPKNAARVKAKLRALQGALQR